MAIGATQRQQNKKNEVRINQQLVRQHLNGTHEMRIKRPLVWQHFSRPTAGHDNEQRDADGIAANEDECALGGRAGSGLVWVETVHRRLASQATNDGVNASFGHPTNLACMQHNAQTIAMSSEL
jgi:hypothetical protein